MKIKVSAAEGVVLDYLVAKAEGYVDYPVDSVEQGRYWHTDNTNAPYGPKIAKESYSPSTDWLQAGPIITRNLHAIDHIQSENVCAILRRNDYKNGGWEFGYGTTILIAAMRCYVLSKLGNEVEIPDELT